MAAEQEPVQERTFSETANEVREALGKQLFELTESIRKRCLRGLGIESEGPQGGVAREISATTTLLGGINIEFNIGPIAYGARRPVVIRELDPMGDPLFDKAGIVGSDGKLMQRAAESSDEDVTEAEWSLEELAGAIDRLHTLESGALAIDIRSAGELPAHAWSPRIVEAS